MGQVAMDDIRCSSLMPFQIPAAMASRIQPSSQRNLRQSCDKCRTRKQTCTKESGGCSRCKGLGIQCRYSARKPTGRPRKTISLVFRGPNVPSSSRPRFAMDYNHILPIDTILHEPTSLQFLDENITPHSTNSISNFWEAGQATMPLSKDTDTCSCLPRIYYDIRTLRALIKEAVPSFKVVRTAVKTAHDALKCTSCSRLMMVSQDPTEKLRALCTLISLIPSFYLQLLQMIECEASLAVAENRQLAFILEETGGLWGNLTGDGKCRDVERLRERPLDPELWRQTMRALLRTDVYGVDLDFYRGDSGKSIKRQRHSGLTDMVGMLDELTTRGPFKQMGGWPVPESSTNFTCMELIAAAKRSVSKLIIV